MSCIYTHTQTHTYTHSPCACVRLAGSSVFLNPALMPVPCSLTHFCCLLHSWYTLWAVSQGSFTKCIRDLSFRQICNFVPLDLLICSQSSQYILQYMKQTRVITVQVVPKNCVNVKNKKKLELQLEVFCLNFDKFLEVWLKGAANVNFFRLSVPFHSIIWQYILYGNVLFSIYE